jgi:hypothetical protein
LDKVNIFMPFQVSRGFVAPTFLLVWMLLQGASTGFAASVKLAWDPNPEPDVVGYRVYWGTEFGRYDQFTEFGLVLQGTVEGLAEGATYYFSAAARNAAGLESRLSAAIPYVVPSSSGGGGIGGGESGGEESSEDRDDPPSAYDTFVELEEDSEAHFILSASSESGGALSYTIAVQPQNGTLSGVPPNLVYRPRRNFHGEDSIAFRVNDGALDSSVALVEILVTPVDDAPVASNAAVSVQEDVGAPVTLRAFDAEGSPLAFVITRPPGNGKLEGTLPNLFYRPAPDFNGPDYFEFTASDGGLVSAAARVSFVVSPVEDPPTAIDQSISLLADARLNMILSGADPEGGILKYSIVREPSKGILVGIPPLVLYVPLLGSQGADSFDFRVTDVAGLSSVGTVQISILPANLPPTANPLSVSVPEDRTASIALLGTDPAGANLTYAITSPPRQGVITGTPPNLSYRPAQDFFGADSFDYTVSNGSRTSGPARVSITVVAVNDAPSAQALVLSIPRNGTAPVILKGSDPEATAISYTVSTMPSQGTLTGTAPNLTYRPALNFVGSDSFRYTVSDGSLNSAVALVSITVTNVNTPPLAASQSLAAAEDTALAISLTGSGGGGQALTYVVSRPPTNGVLTGIPPNLTYTPKTNFFGTDSFEFTVGDGVDASVPAVVSISVTPVNDPPSAFVQSVTSVEEIPRLIRLNGTDPDGDTLAYTIIRPPAHGTLSGTPPTVIYTPKPDFSGSDSFEFSARDAEATSAPALVAISVAPVNDAPLASAQSLTTPENSSRLIQLIGTDADGDNLVYTIVRPPAQGTLSGTPPNVTYTPKVNFSGTDSFEFSVRDAVVASAGAVVSISVTEGNSPPVASALSVTLAEDSSQLLRLIGTDVDGDALSYTIVRPPAQGTLSGTPPNVTYTPKANFFGADSFEFSVKDAVATSAPAVVSISVTSVNDAPSAFAQSVTLSEDVVRFIRLSGTDADGDLLAYAIVRPPAHGTLSGTPPTVNYTPKADFFGSDSFEFSVKDAAGISALAVVTVSVAPVNDAPLASGQSLTLAEDSSRLIRLNGTDPDGDTLAYTIVRPPAQGTLSGTPPNVTYTPKADFSGTDSFEFSVRDALATSAPAVVSIVVTPVNNAPLASEQSLTLAEDSSRLIRLNGTDPDGDTLAYTIVRPPAQGTLSGTPPNVTYAPKADFSGTDSFEFSVRDALATSAPAVVSIVVTPVNDAPLASAQSLTLAEDSSRLIRLNGTDADGDTLAYTIVRPPAQGTLSGTPPNVTYAPKADFSGTDSFEFSVRDALATSTPAAVSIVVTPVNDAPLASGQSLTLAEDSSGLIRLNGTDPDGDTLAYTIVRPPAQGTLSGTPPNVTYAPKADFSGTDSFEFSVRDALATSAPAVVSIVVTRVNNAPLASAQSLTLAEDSSRLIRLNGTDPDGDTLAYTIVRPPAQGTLSGTPPNVTYAPKADFSGTDSFEFSVRDALATSAPAVVSIVVTPVNDAPLASAQSLTLAEDSSRLIRLNGTDADGDTLAYTIVRPPAQGTLSGTPPNVTYTPKANFFGADSFEFSVRDALGTSAPAGVTISLTPVNDAPTASSQSLTLSQGSPLVIRLTGQDVDGDTLAYSIARSPLNGTIAGTPPNVTYTPNAGFAGEDSFEFLVRDRTLTSVPGRVALTVIAVNRAPVATAGDVSGLEDSSIPITLTGSDADGDALTYAVVGAPQQGAISGVAPNLVYRPETNFFGTDTIQFTVSDGTQISASATLTIQVAPVNDAPTANGQNAVTGYGMPVAVTLTGSDPEGSPLTYRVLTSPANGTLSGTMPNPLYTPRPGYSGMDFFTVVASDGTLESAPATVLVRISLILLASNRGAVVPIAGDSSGDALPVAGDSGDRMVGATSTTTGGDPVEWLSLPTHGMVDASRAGEVSYEPALDGSTLDSFSFRINGEGGPSEPMVVALHLVGFQEVKRMKGEVQVTFPTIAGLTYRVEWNDASPSAASNWQVWETLTPADPGIVSVRVANPPDGVFRFIRLTCEGTENQVVSEPWGVSSASVVGGMDGRVYSVPFQGPIRLRGRVQSVTGSSIEIEAGTMEVPSLEPVVGQVTHALMVRSSKLDARSAGAWWAITGQANRGIQVEEGIESLAECVRAGDEVEIVRLLTVAEVFGKASSPEIQLSDGDRLSISGLGGVDYLIEYRISNRGGASYWIVQGDTLAGPFDGTTLPLPPFPTFHFVDRVSPGSVVLVGRVQDGPAVQYLHPGARMVGNAFPVAMEVPELSPYRLAPGDYPWLETGLGTAPEICPPWASNTGGIGAGAGLWIRIPEETGVLRWVQQCPWPIP